MNQSFAIAAGHESTLAAASEILKAGGNAFDAVIAAYAVSWIAEPAMAGAAGGAFANLRTYNGDSFILDFFCQTPKQKKAAKAVDFFPIEVNFGTTTETFHIGKGASATPGSVAGIYALHDRFGTIPMIELLQPAIELAKNGVVINDFQYLDFQLLESILRQDKQADSIFFDNEKLKKPGQKILMPQFADFLDYLGREGKNAFYRGEVAQKVVRDYQSGGGFLTMNDFENYQVIWRRPLVFPFRNRTILTNPLPSTGGSLMAIFMKYLENFEIPKQAISKEHLTQILQAFLKINSIEKSTDGIAKMLNQILPNHIPFMKSRSSKRGATTHMNIVDKWGNAISLTASLGEGCGYFIEGTDIQMNNMLGEAALLPNGFHSWQPDVRLSSMMAPTLVLNENQQTEIVTGSGGAGRIPYAIAQVLKYLIDHNMDIEEAVNTPRIHLEHGILNVENEFSAFDIATNHKIKMKIWKEKSLYFGGAHTIQIQKDTIQAVGDNRRDGVGASR